jgi:Tfp pilus assembly protein PilX
MDRTIEKCFMKGSIMRASGVVLIVVIVLLIVLLAKIMPLLSSVTEQMQARAQADQTFAVLCFGLICLIVLAFVAVICSFFNR